MKCRIAFGSIVAVALNGVCGGDAAGSVVTLISEPNMPAGVFSQSAINTSGGFSFVVGVSGSGGNPDAYRSIRHSSTSGIAQGTVVHTHQTTWNPLLNDAIYTIDMGIDVNCFNGGTSGAVGFGLVIVQNGVVYYGPSFAPGTASGWRTSLRRTGLRATDFSNGVLHPDFTPSGSTISFGFYSANGTISGVPISSSSGADNFTVTIHTCEADANGDGFVDGFDYDDYVSCFEGTANPPCAPGVWSDFNGDGFVDGFDYDDFIAAFETGC